MGFLFGPVTHAWYKILDRYLPGTAVITVGKKILADQAVAGPFFCSAFFMGKWTNLCVRVCFSFFSCRIFLFN